MKKILIFTLMFIASVTLLTAGITDYYNAPVASSGTYEAITGTSAGAGGDTFMSAALNIGFTFNYCGTAYTQVKMASDGYLVVGTGLTNSVMTNALASTTNRPVIAPLWDDLTSSGMTYTSNGSAPNRVFIAQWANVKWNYNGTAGQNFQVRLYETTDKIEIIYGAMITPGSPSASIGINSLPGGSGNYFSITPGTTISYSTTTENTTINSITYLTSGTTYTFNKYVSSTPPNAAITPYPVNNAVTVSRNPVLTWVSGGGLPTGYKVYFGATLPAEPNASVASTTWTPTGPLLYSTPYVWKVVPFNANGDCATGIVTWSFTTEADPTIIPNWAESFDNTIFPPNAAWKNVKTAGTGTTGTWDRVTTGSNPTCANHTGAGMIRYNCYASTHNAGTKGELSTPPITFTSDDYRVSFWMYRDSGYPTYETELVNVYYSATGQTSVGATLLGTVHRAMGLAPIVATEGWYNYKFNMPVGATGNGRYLIFEAISAYGNNIFVDDIAIEQIPSNPIFSYNSTPLVFPFTLSGAVSAAQNVSVSNIGGGSLQLTVANISLRGTNATDFSFSAANLTDPILSGQSVNIPVTFEPQSEGAKTATLVINYDSIDYEVALSGYAYAETALLEDFEGTFPPVGWANPGSWSKSTSTYYAGIGSAYKSGSSSTTYILSTPKLELESDSKLVFMARISSITSALDIVYSTNRTTWTKLGNSILAPTINTWFQNVINLSAIPDRAGRYYLGFRTMGSASYYVDNVIMPAAAQEAPEAVTLSSPINAAANQGLLPTLSWTPAANGGIPSSYDIYLEATTMPVAPDADPRELLTNVTTTSYTYTAPLAYSTTYIWKVVAKNAIGDAPGSVVRSFTTLADPILSPPFIVDFGTVSGDWPVANWTQLSGSYPTPTGTTVQWYKDEWINGPLGNNAAKINIFGTTRYGWLVTPPIAIAATGYELNFDLGLTRYGNTSAVDPLAQADDRFIVAISDSPLMTAPTILREWNNISSTDVFNQISNTGTMVTIDLSAYTGIKYIAFYGESTVTDNGDNDLFVDNVAVRETPANPVFTLSPDISSWGFGKTAINDSIVKQFTISNTGGGTLILGSVVATGDYYSISVAPAVTELTAGQSTAFTVQYAPTVVGALHEGLVSISYNGPAAKEISLTGSCYAPATLPLSEDFETGIGDWVVLNGTQANQWHVGAATAHESTQSAYISNDGGTTNSYNMTSASVVHLYQDIAFTSGSMDFPLSFWYKGNGESTYDYLQVSLVDTATMPIPGTQLASGQIGVRYNLKTAWTQVNLTLPGTHSGNTMRLVFSWRNDSSGGLQAPIAVDDILLTATPLPTEPVFSVSPETKAFATAQISTISAAQVFTIKNTGGGILIVDPAIVITGTDLGQFQLTDLNTYPKSLARNETMTVSVVFAPASIGAKSANLKIVDNISKGEHLVPLTGTGFDSTIRDLPYIQTWDVPALANAWVVKDVNADNTTWGIVTDGGSKAAKITYNYNNASDDWLISPPVILNAGTTYTVSYKYRAHNGTNPEKMKVAFGNDQTPAAMTAVIATHDPFSNVAYDTNSVTYTPPTTGAHYLGFHAYSAANKWGIYVDDIRILLPNTQIAEVTATGATATVTVPAITVGAEQISPVLAFANLSGNPVIHVSSSYGLTAEPLTNERLVLSIDAGNLTGVQLSFTHGLGFIPQALTYQLGGGEYIMVPNPGDWSATNAYFTMPSVNESSTLKVIFPNGVDDTLPVELSSFTAVLTADMYVQIAWVVQSETGHLGYYVLRNTERELNTAIALNSELISSGEALGSQISYNYTDAEVDNNSTYYYWLQSFDQGGTVQFFGPLLVLVNSSPDDPGIPVTPMATKLMDAFPNPFNPSTTLRYAIKDAGNVRIDIFNMRGQMLRSYANSHTTPGYYSVVWDGKDASGKTVGSGIYLYRMSSGKYTSTKKMLMSK